MILIVLGKKSYMGCPFPPSLIGMLEIEDMFLVLPKLTSNFALIPGSSMQGNALLASVAWN